MSDNLARQTAITTLHPAIRKPVSDILKQLRAEGLAFEVFESWRSPDLQQHYFAKGRNSTGKITNRGKVITFARPWQSFHQYGLAVDLVLREGKRWSWDDTGNNRQKWQRMHEVARDHGLKPLKFEKPHIQLASIGSSSTLLAGKYPEGGDPAWRRKLGEQIMAWQGSPPAPPLPDFPTERPTLNSATGTADSAWPRIVQEIIKLEGGYVNHPNDPGGPTNMGITLKTLKNWRGSSVTAAEVKSLTRKEAVEIYRKNYFEAVRANEMPPAVSTHVFNMAVLSGPVRAAKFLQKSLNAAGASIIVDGVIGPRTMAAIGIVGDYELVEACRNIYLEYLKSLKHWPLFGRGWNNRLETIHTLSLEFAGSRLPNDYGTQNIHVWVFGGLFGRFFSTGLKKLALVLKEDGHTVHEAKWYDRRTIEKEIKKRLSKADLPQIALIGHSLGANAVLRLTRNLSQEGVTVDYLATIDPTISIAGGKAETTHNFRSTDRRARPIAGALEHLYPQLDHVGIAGAEEVHRHIIGAVENISKPDAAKEEADMIQNEETRAGTDKTGIPTEELREELMHLITILAENNGRGTARRSPITPVNALFGEGAVSRFLDGKKTGIGIVGLVAVNVLPVLFPQSAPLIAMLKEFGLEEIASDPEAGTKLLTAMFSAIAAWGGIGKLDKWVHQLAKRQVIEP